MEFFYKIKNFWKKYDFEIIIGLSLVVILIMIFIRLGKKGTWQDKIFLPGKHGRKNKEVFTDTTAETPKPSTDSKGETECRRALEEIFGKNFKKDRPDFLRNPVTANGEKGYNLELDCYNSELKIACEYQGVQHYKYTPYFHRTKEAFQNQKYKDYIKRDLCRKNGIFLIEVPYTVKIEDIKKFLVEQMKAKI